MAGEFSEILIDFPTSHRVMTALIRIRVKKQFSCV